MYRLITESLLGLQLEANTLRFTPRPPKSWPSFKFHYRFRETLYHIMIQNGGDGKTIRRMTIDGVDQSEHIVFLVNDQGNHDVGIELE